MPLMRLPAVTKTRNPIPRLPQARTPALRLPKSRNPRAMIGKLFGAEWAWDSDEGLTSRAHHEGGAI
jgi:hypothetical protein